MTEGDSCLRLFIAVNPPAEIRQHLTQVQQRLRRLPALARARFPRMANLHVTLKFLGPVEADAQQRLTAALAQVRFAPFTAGLSALGTFGRRHVRVVWLGLESPGLCALQADVQECLAADFPTDERAFHPHLTLARPRSKVQARRLQPQLQGLDLPTAEWVVDSFALMASELHPDGARHTCMAQIAADRTTP